MSKVIRDCFGFALFHRVIGPETRGDLVNLRYEQFVSTMNFPIGRCDIFLCLISSSFWFYNTLYKCTLAKALVCKVRTEGSLKTSWQTQIFILYHARMECSNLFIKFFCHLTTA